MKNLLLTSVAGFMFTLIACNENAGKDTEDSAKSDTTTIANENAVAPANTVVTQTSLPLASDQEVPVNKSTASGTADVSYNKDTKMLTYTVNWNGLTGNATMAHIHGTAARGTNAGVKHDLSNVLKKETSGTFTDSVKIDVASITEDSLLAGFYYFNIHTPANPGGEIRGQIEFK